MAVKTLGTSATDSLTSLTFAGGIGGMNFADLATIANRIRDDKNVAHPVIPASFTPAGLLYVPRRGVLKILPGDYVGVDSQGWPVLVSARSVANGAWRVNQPPFAPFTADFVNGVYTVGGQLSTIGNVLGQDTVNWGTFDPTTAIQAGTGMRADTQTGFTSEPVLTGVPLSSLLPVGGMTLVATVTFPAAGQVLQLVLYDAVQRENIAALTLGAGIQQTQYAMFNNPAGTTPGLAAGAHKIAVTMTTGEVAFSIDGGAVLSQVSDTGLTVTNLGIDVISDGSVLKTLSGQAAVDDSALPALSV